MLRREFLAAVASFTAAGAAARAALAAVDTPQEKAGKFLRDLRCHKPEPGAVPEFSDALAAAIDERSRFERTLIDCLRDGSLVLMGVTNSRGGDYMAFYRSADGAVSRSVEDERHQTLMAMYDRGLIAIDSVNVFNAYTGVEVIFSICTKGDY